MVAQAQLHVVPFEAREETLHCSEQVCMDRCIIDANIETLHRDACSAPRLPRLQRNAFHIFDSDDCAAYRVVLYRRGVDTHRRALSIVNSTLDCSSEVDSEL